MRYRKSGWSTQGFGCNVDFGQKYLEIEMLIKCHGNQIINDSGCKND